MVNLSTLVVTKGVSSIPVTQISNISTSAVSSSNVSGALVELHSKKQDQLVSGVNIKTINNNSLLNTGNISLGGSITNPVEPGSIIRSFDQTPGGYLPCNGALLDQATYPDLYAAVGDDFSYYANRYINGQPWRQQFKTNIGDGVIGTWTTGTSLPAGAHYSQAIVTNSRVYLIGGISNTTYTSAVYTAPINSDGTIGTWTTGTSLPGVLGGSSVIMTNSRVYLLGGTTVGSNAIDTVYTAPINADGTLGTWTTAPALAYPTNFSQAIVTHSRVYLISGLNSIGSVHNVVQSAPINADGTLGTWTTGTAFPANITYAAGTIVTNSRVYFIGGYNGSAFVGTVYTAPINTDGTLGAWVADTSLPGIFSLAQVITINSRVYLIGGYNSAPSSIVYTAAINSDGTLGGWSTTLAAPNTLYGGQAVITNSRVYLLGLSNALNTSLTTTYSAPLSGGKNNYLNDTFYQTTPVSGKFYIPDLIGEEVPINNTTVRSYIKY